MSLPQPKRPDLSMGKVAHLLLERIPHPNTKAMYAKALEDFFAWCQGEGSPSLTNLVVEQHKAFLVAKGYSASTINQRLTSIRQFAVRASEEGLLSAELAAAISRVKGARKIAVTSGALLTVAQAELLMNVPDERTAKGKRDRALLAMLVGCGLRRKEIVRLNVEDVQREDGRWVLAGVGARQRKSRVVPLPIWAKQAIDKWLGASEIRSGPIFQAVDRDGLPTGRGLSPAMVLEIVRSYGKRVGLKINPRDLRRTCASLCRKRGADLEQIQVLLGHSNIQMTEQFLGARQKPVKAPNDRLVLRWHRAKKLAG